MATVPSIREYCGSCGLHLGGGGSQSNRPRQVRHEYRHVASADFRRGRAAFMATFIEQNPLYFTAEVPLGRDSSRVISDRHPSEGRIENKQNHYGLSV